MGDLKELGNTTGWRVTIDGEGKGRDEKQKQKQKVGTRDEFLSHE